MRMSLIVLAVLLIAINVALLFALQGRFSNNQPSASNLEIAVEQDPSKIQLGAPDPANGMNI